MFLKNNSRRLISINFPPATAKDKPIKYDIKPAGDLVEVDDKAKELPFVKKMLDIGDLVAVEQDPPAKTQKK
ncbi:hypothetical protein [Sessilibacter corallicola]|uniref:hypothetical protein n=1 Tax=Sessilibacter corallicola TaxID=2904075 RepID=UPI001E63B8EF|nr:hypothetical protein [Sessilibacter corallicola]MCE2029286.1 hypothetical protein [Sessilibacter corallicola]